MSTPKMLGRKMDPSLDRVAVSANPTEQYIYEFACVSSVAAQFNIICRMTYWVEFSDRATVFILINSNKLYFHHVFRNRYGGHSAAAESRNADLAQKSYKPRIIFISLKDQKNLFYFEYLCQYTRK